MKQNNNTNFIQILGHYYRLHKRLIAYLTVATFVVPIVLLFLATLIISPYGRYTLPADNDKHFAVGLVLGSGITQEGKPYKGLQARLDIAANALEEGRVDKLILSGDNRLNEYNEPDAMIRYLTKEKGISASKLQPDYAGLSTYESCERASKVFGLSQTIIFSADSHLPRAIYLCRHFGIEAYGIASKVEANNSGRREPLARLKAIYNIYINGENTILGPSIQL